MWSSTRMPPVGPISSPASRASRVSGLMPTARITNSAANRSSFCVTTVIVSSGPGSKAATALPSRSSTPCRSSSSLDRRDHLGVDRRHDLAGHFQQRDGDAAAAEVLGHLQADVAAADHHRPARLAAMADPGVDLVHVVEVAQGEDAGQVDARQRRPHRRGPGAPAPARRRARGRRRRSEGSGPRWSGSARSMRRTSCQRADLDAEEVAEPLGRGDQQLPAVGDHAADVIRQAAVGERNVAAPLEDEDFGAFIHAAEPGRARAPPATPPTIRPVWRT